MHTRNRLTYSALPTALRSAIPEALFLKALEHAEAQTLIVWQIDPALDTQREIEFSPRLARPLSRAEREAQFPAPRDVVLQDEGVRVRIDNWLAPDTDVRYETYAVFDPDTSVKLAECQQLVFLPTMQQPAEVVRAALERVRFPARYAAWAPEERIRYWVGRLYRIRRQVGESGLDEAAAFGPDLLAQMRAVDPAIDGLLGAVLTEPARMEGMRADSMLTAFNQRSGTSIG
ncbi:MAG: hypothetical protein V4764_05840 [Burkholderia sp.]